MGGKHKQAQRTKNNARPSSSGRSAELLGNSVNPFVSFSTIQDTKYVPALPAFSFSAVATEEIDPNLDPNFQLVLKKMNKKDAKTKLKALQEFTELVDNSQSETVKAVLPFWPRIYSVLALDVEHRVRQATHVAHRAVFLKVKRNLAPYLKQMIGPWFTSQYDTYPPAATAAVVSFNDAFPANKVQEAIVFCQEEIINYICDNLYVQTAETLATARKLSKEEAEAKYERLLISSLQGYTLYLNKLSGEQLFAAENINAPIVSNPKFSMICKSTVPLVRIAWFGCISAICQNAPYLLGSTVGGKVIAAVFDNLDETEPAVLPSTWEAAILCIKSCLDWWHFVNVHTHLLPKLWYILHEGGLGNAALVYPHLLPFLSEIPNIFHMDTFYKNFFENMFAGMKKRSVMQSRSEFFAIVTSYVECIRYIIMANIQDSILCETLISRHLIAVIEWHIIDKIVSTKCLFGEVSILLQYWAKNLNTPGYTGYRQCTNSFWTSVRQIFKKCLSSYESVQEKTELYQIANKQVELLLCLKRCGMFKQRQNLKVNFAVSDVKLGTVGDTVDNTIKDTVSEIYLKDLNNLVYETCSLYLTLVKEEECCELIKCLSQLVQEFHSRELFLYLQTQFCKQNGDQRLINVHNNLFYALLMQHSTRFETLVDMIFTLYKYLEEDEQVAVLSSLSELGLDECLCWTIARAIRHPYCEDSNMKKWLHNKEVSDFLVKISRSMLSGEITVEETLLIKQALNHNASGDVLISKQACSEIMQIFCNVLLSPSDYPFTIDNCASFACQLASALYSEKSLLSYGDQLVIALFSMTCNNNFSQDIVTKDTLWEINTAWQDVLAILVTSDQPASADLKKLIQEFTKIIKNELFNEFNPSVLDELKDVAVDLIKTVVKSCDNNLDTVKYTLTTVLKSPEIVRIAGIKVRDMCVCSELIRGNLTFYLNCPILFDALEEINENLDVVKYVIWNQFVVKVLSVLYSSKNDITNDEEDEIDEENKPILKKTSDDVDLLIISALRCYIVVKLFMNNYKNTNVYNKIALHMDNMDADCCYFINDILVTAGLFEHILVKIKENEHNDILWPYLIYILYRELYANEILMMDLYRSLTRSMELEEIERLRLTQVFASHVTYQCVVPSKTRIHMYIITRALVHCQHTDVQIAEALSVASFLQGKNEDVLLYNRNISSSNWESLQSVVEMVRTLSAIIDNKYQCLSAQHWDFILISLTAWAGSVDKSKTKYRQVGVASFIMAICQLYISFHKLITDEERISNLSPSCSSFVKEYLDLFAQDVNAAFLNTWLYIAEKELETQEHVCMKRLPLLEIIGSVVTELDPKCFVKMNDDNLPKWQTLMTMSYKLVQSSSHLLQLWAYHMLHTMLPELVQIDAGSVNSQHTHGIMCPAINPVLNSIQDVVQIMLMEFRLGEDSCRVKPFTDSYRFTLGYLLLWDIFLSLCQQASTDLHYQYLDWLRTGDHIKNLLNNLFRLMPTEALHSSEGKKTAITELFTTKPSFSMTEACTSEILEHMVCWVYCRALAQLPALVRQWWSDAEPRVAQIVEQVTATYVSPLLCVQELQDVMEKERSSKNNMKVKVYPSAREVIAVYTVDEARMELIITLPSNYPLGSVQVDCSKQIGGSAQWRNWVMQLTIFLTHQNGRIWDGLSLWKSNLDKKFDGVEECYICFSVLHNTTYQLPKLVCQTCKKKFHSTCLYKWFSTSNKSTCPICRNLF